MPKGKIDRLLAEATRGRGIGHRIAVLVVLAVLTAVFILTAIFVYRGVINDFAARKRSLEATGYVFASAIADHVADKDAQESLRVLRSISRIPEITYAAVLDQDGKAFASLGSAIVLDSAALRSDIGIIEGLSTGTYPVAIDIIKSGQTIGKVLLINDISDLRKQLIEAIVTGLALAMLAIVVSLAMARRLQRRITAPILSLTAAMQEIHTTSLYDRQVVNEAEGETALLIDSFNAMIAEIHSRDDALVKHRQTLESTVEQRTHELRLARDAAESANQAKSSFLATMSHEIRTPLNGLMVMAELLAGAGLDQKLQRYAEVIVKSGQSLLTIINDILDLSKIEAGKLELESIPVNPAAIADDVTSLFWEKASSKGLDLAACVAADVPAAIYGDPVRLNQILCNLVNNALKFTAEGEVLVCLGHEDGQLTLAVTDTGIGIPKKKLDQLFAAFSQADQTITRKFGGSGLGLAICKRLAEAMGGTIGVDSEAGKGSTFWVRLPVTPVPDAKPAVEASAAGLRAGIIVDGRATQSALGTALEAAGFEVRLLDRAEAGLDVLFASAAYLRSAMPAAGPRPATICLGTLGDSDGEAAIAEGNADDMIILPVRQRDIAEMIGRIRRGRLRGRSLLERRSHAARPNISFKGRYVLVADDNAINREVIIEVLRQLDVTVDVACDGREAVEEWRKSAPDLIFMDCSMPGMDGYTATREIRAHEALAIGGGHTPIVALTAQVAGGTGETWRSAGMDAYMTKPFTLDQVVSCLQAYFTGLPLRDEMAALLDEPGEILDDAVLDDIRKIGGNDALFRRVLDLFASRVPAAVDKVTALAGDADLEALASAVHALKSMCANIGAHRAVEACHDLEYAAREGTVFDAGPLVAAMIREVRRVVTEVDRLRAA